MNEAELKFRSHFHYRLRQSFSRDVLFLSKIPVRE